MKRLYVRAAARGTGAGRALADAAVAEGRRMGYAAMRLDTLSSMKAALSLYRALGFREIPAYYETPIADTVFLHKDL
jgi:ribosomal protein S18 acetylase RimI-like enzyme